LEIYLLNFFAVLVVSYWFTVYKLLIPMGPFIKFITYFKVLGLQIDFKKFDKNGQFRA
jgi:hypothetical protein